MLIEDRVERLSKICSILGLGISLFAGNALAEPWGAGITPVYAPDFEPGSVHAVKLTECKVTPAMVYWAGGRAGANCAGYDISLVSISKSKKPVEGGNEATYVVVKLQEKGKVVAKAVLKLSDFGANYLDDAHYADLNGDGKPDFIIEMGSHGNGLAGEFADKLFLLSNDEGYRYLIMRDVMSDSRLVRFANDRNVTLILQRMPSSSEDGSSLVRSLDKKDHSYFHFDLVQFDSASPKGAKLNNEQDARFPFWTLYTNKPQKTETALLASDRKKSLWRDPLVVAGKLVVR